MTSPPIAIALIMESTGELHCLLPILWLAKDACPELELVVIFRRADTRARFAEDPVYSEILADLGARVGGLPLLLQTLWRSRQNVRVIFKDYSPSPAGSLAPVVKQCCPRATLVLFPHAYALYGTLQGKAPEPGKRNRFAQYDQAAIDALLVNSPLDVEGWSNRVEKTKIRVVGATGYTQQWAQHLQAYARRQQSASVQQFAGRVPVLLTTRGPHEQFLTPENYDYLIQHALQVILERPDTVILLKPHPREDVARLKQMLLAFPQERVRLTWLNTFALAGIAQVTVSLWSSAVLDSVAVGTPAIEFHRFHRPHHQTTLDALGRIVSIYTSAGLALRADSADELRAALDKALGERSALLAEQRAALARCFPGSEEGRAPLQAWLRELLVGSSRGRSQTSGSVIGASRVILTLIGRDWLKRQK